MRTCFSSLMIGCFVGASLLLCSAADMPSVQASVLQGTAVETMDSGGYTYVLIDAGTQKIWAAAFPFVVKPGEKVVVNSGYEMDDFQSPTLDRKFDRIYFVSSMTVGTNGNVSASLPAGHPDIRQSAPSLVPPSDGIKGAVVETMNAGGYTYVKVESGKEAIWAAANRFQVKVGDKVTVPRGQVMKDFTSPTLKRTFKEIYFVGHVFVEDKEDASTTKSQSDGMTVPAITKQIVLPSGGKRLSEVYENRKALAGKEVLVKGQVTKFTADVLDRNWIHISDGTGEDNPVDMVVTTTDTAAVGDLITVSGKVAVDQNYGSGYAYPVLIEKASVQK